MQSTRWPTAFFPSGGKSCSAYSFGSHHLGLVVEVGLRDEASVNHVKPVEVAGRWENPGETGFHICCVSCHAGLPAVEFGGHLLHHVALLAAEGVDVVVLEIYASSLSVATVRLGGHAAPYRNLLVVALTRVISMNMPHATDSPVRAVRSLLWRIVCNISLAKSNTSLSVVCDD